MQAGAWPSNYVWSLPMICTRSPRQARRLRDWCTFGGRSFRGIQKPASIMIRRTQAGEFSMPWRSRSFSQASVGPKSA